MFNLTKVIATGEPPYENGFQQLRWKALRAAMRSLPVTACAEHIMARADSLLYDRRFIYFDTENAAWIKGLPPGGKAPKLEAEEE